MPHWLESAAGYLVGALGAGGGFWAWLSSRNKGKADLATGLATFQDVLVKQGGQFTNTLLAMIERNETTIRENHKTIAALEQRLVVVEAENIRCQGENAGLKADVAALRRALVARGIDVPSPPPPVAIAEVQAEGVTLIKGVRGPTPQPKPPATGGSPRRRRKPKTPR